MKKLKLKLAIPIIVVLLFAAYACQKSFLDKQPLGSLSPSLLANKTGVQGLLIGAYHSLLGETNWGSAPSNWPFGSVAGGESYKGSTPSDQGDIVPIEIWSYNTNNPYFEQKWNGIYHGAQRANEVLRVMALATDIAAADVKVINGEVRFLRGYWHMEAKKFWKNVPYVDENISPTNSNINVANVDASGAYVDIWPKIEADFQAAMDNLPDVQPQAGRANKWAAAAFLAKAYMIENKYVQAKTLFDQIIASGKTAKGASYALVNYASNFNAAQDNSAESVFAVQASVNDNSGTNGNYGDNLQFPNGSGAPGGCCGFNNPSISLANSYKTDAVTGLPLFTTFNTAGGNVSAPSGAYTGTLDPRIDFAMGRPGIPYLDWGPYPRDSWIREPATNGYFSPKKIVYAKAQIGTISSTETSFWGPTQMSAINVNLMRYSDVLLMAAEAEAEAGTGTLAKALTYVNQVRTRAANPTGWVYKNSEFDAATATYKTQTTPADNYKIANYAAFPDKAYALQAIYFERKLELAMEGHRFFDLQRWDRGTGLMATELNAFAAAEKSRPTLFAVNPSATFTKGKNEYFPIPQGQIDIENATGTVNLKQNPGY